MRVSRVVRGVRQCQVLLVYFRRSAFLVNVLLLQLVGRIRVCVTIFFLYFHAYVRVLPRVFRDLFVLLRVVNQGDYMVRCQNVATIFERRFAAGHQRLQRVGVDDDGVRHFYQLLLLKMVRHSIR